MRVLSIIFSLMIVAMVSSCGAAKEAGMTSRSEAFVDSLMQSKAFKVVNQWALPTMSSSMMKLASSGIMGPGNSGQRIELSGNANFLKFKGDSVHAFLPYFGVRQMGGGYNTDGEGISFDQVAEDLEYKYDRIKERYLIKFKANNGAESFELTLYVFPNKKTTLLVSSSQRDMIRYEGTVNPLSNNDK